MASPLYRKIAQQIKQEIEAGNWKEGEAIPTEKHLSEKYDASRVTIRQAVKTLVEEGLLKRIQGSGTYVSEKKIEHNIYELESFTEEMRRLNKQPVNNVMNFQMIDPPMHVKSKLQLGEEEKVFYVRRQRLVDDIPYVLEDTYLPVRLFPDLSFKVMSGSKYDYIEKEQGKKIKESFQEVIPILPDSDIAGALGVQETTPILKIQHYSVFQDDTIFEYSENYFKSDEYKFTLRAKRPN
ncbi:GntR family transcriptional regulator [Thalassobacillus cyri]|nr:GntR family transcriptional regulator [Thalassobacillus cyri]